MPVAKGGIWYEVTLDWGDGEQWLAKVKFEKDTDISHYPFYTRWNKRGGFRTPKCTAMRILDKT